MMKNNQSIFWGLWCAFCPLVLNQCGDDNPQQAQFKATLTDFRSLAPIPGGKVIALDNDTGEVIPGQEAISDELGLVVFNDLEKAMVGFLAVGVVGESKDTYQFNYESDTQADEIWLVDLATYQLAPVLAGITLDTNKGSIAGGIYWVNQEEEEEIVGCTTVNSSPPEGDVRYFGDNGLPTKLEEQSYANPLNGNFLISNLTPGKITIKAYLENQEKSSMNLFTYKDALSISNFYLEGTSNPQPATCQ